MLEPEYNPIITLSVNELETLILESFLTVIQNPDLVDQAIIAEEAIQSKSLSKLMACKKTNASLTLPLSTLEKIGLIETSKDSEFDSAHPAFSFLHLEWNKPERFRGQCQRLGLENAETLSIPACLRVRAAVQYASNAVIDSEKVRWLNAYINSLDMEKSEELQAFIVANQINAAVAQTEELLKTIALSFDERGFATHLMIASVREKIAELKGRDSTDSLTCVINKERVEEPVRASFKESLHYRFCFLDRFIQNYAEEKCQTSREPDEIRNNRRAIILLELIQQAIIVMAQEGKWQTSYQLRDTQIDAETSAFNVPYSIFQQSELFHQYRTGEREAIDVLAEILRVSKDYDNESWLRWLQSWVAPQCPVAMRWHQLLKIQNMGDLLGDDANFSAFIEDVKTFSDELYVVDPESGWILICEEMGDTQYRSQSTAQLPLVAGHGFAEEKDDSANPTNLNMRAACTDDSL